MGDVDDGFAPLPERVEAAGVVARMEHDVASLRAERSQLAARLDVIDRSLARLLGGFHGDGELGHAREVLAKTIRLGQRPLLEAQGKRWTLEHAGGRRVVLIRTGALGFRRVAVQIEDLPVESQTLLMQWRVQNTKYTEASRRRLEEEGWS